MSGISDRISRHVRDMHGYVPGEQPKIAGLIKLNTNENPYPPSPRVLQVLKDAGECALRLYPDPVCSELRKQIAGHLGCQPEQIFVGNGSDEVLALCTRAFVEDDGSIGYFDPTYSLYPILAAIRHVAVKPVELSPDFEWQMPANFMASLFYLTNPNAPTGLMFPKEKIKPFCDTFSGLVLIDEAYADFARWNCMDLALSNPRVMVSRSFSKSYSLAGMRVGYAVGHPELIGALYKIKDSYNVNALTQRMALAAFSDQEYMRKNVEKILSTRDRVAQELRKAGHHVYPSSTNFLWIKPAGISAEELYRHLRDRSVLTRYFPGEKTGHCLRITIGTDEQMAAFMAALRS